MIKVAMLFQESETDNMDLSMPEKGNPGVGGTAFCFLLLSKFLMDKKEIDLTIYQFQNNILPCKKTKKVSDLNEALKAAKEDGNEIVLARNHQEMDAYEIMKNYDFKYIFWMHNKLTYKEIRLFRSWKAVKRVIAVGREMYDYYIDDLVSEKLDYAINMFVPPAEEMKRGNEYEPIVTYMGSLTYDKNFHLLTAVWKDVLKEVADAKLHVIGSGRLYDKNSVMGNLGFAEKEYEDMFLPGITDEKGELLPGIHFYGILGDEKYEVFRESAVGVVNPMATETFCLAAIEMEACGLPVVTRRKNGLLDTVMDGKTGILYKDISSLAEVIIKLLKDKELNDNYGKAAVSFARNDFLPEKIIPKWIAIFNEVHEDKKASFHKPKNNMDNNGKNIRAIMHAIHAIPFLRWIPSIHDLQKK